MKIIAKNSNDAMKLILEKLKVAKETKPRGMRVKEIINLNLTINDVHDNGYITEHLPVDKNYADAEIKLYESGSRKLEDYAKISKFWNKVSDDNVTIRSAYGFIIQTKHGFDQFTYCLNELLKDNDTRKAVITLKTPYNKDTKDNICTLSLQFLIRNNELHLITSMRSNDIEYGFRNDLPYFIHLQNKMIESINFSKYEERMHNKDIEFIKLGKYHHNVGSMHMYERTMKRLGWE